MIHLQSENHSQTAMIFYTFILNSLTVPDKLGNHSQTVLVTILAQQKSKIKFVRRRENHHILRTIENSQNALIIYCEKKLSSTFSIFETCAASHVKS